MNEFEKLENRVRKLESKVKELKKKHVFMQNAIKRKAGMLEPIRKEAWRFKTK